MTDTDVRSAPTAATRTETDSLGAVEIPAAAYWGAHTARALENFPISNTPISRHPRLVDALAIVKQAAARANRDLGVLEPGKAAMIERACVAIREGAHHDQFVVDVIQGGAGTSTNMNANEVVANVALRARGPRARRLRDAQPDRRRQPQPEHERRLPDRREDRDRDGARGPARRAHRAEARVRATRATSSTTC